MSKKIYINDEFSIDLETLVKSKLLVQANSGGGKSWLLRRILEQSHGHIQQIVIDLEGEFYTLREKYNDYLLIGKGGDMTADLRAAGLLATSLLELGTSAIIDLSELKFHERKHFVRLFLESMIDAPEELNHPCLVVIDEAHHFAPEKGESEAAGAVIDLCTRGRKRGYCAVLATQRISKLAKDAVAEINNKLIGRTSLDIDMKRASDELGFTSKEQFMSLRTLKPGEFFAFGTALTSDVTKVTVGDVKTTHEREGGGKARKAAPPSAAIKSVLGKLADLPQEAEKKAKSEGELRKELAETRRNLSIANKHLEEKVLQLVRRPEATKVERIEVPAVGKRALIGIKKVETNARRMVGKAREYALEAENAAETIMGAINRLTVELEKVSHPLVFGDGIKIMDKPFFAPAVVVPVKEAREWVGSIGDTKVAIKEGARKMLGVLIARRPDWLSRHDIGVLAVFKSSGGTFGTYISNLKVAGYITERDGRFTATEEGVAFLGEQPEQTSAERRDMWRGRLKEGARRMFDKIVNAYPSAITKEELGLSLGMVHTGGTFGTYISNMRSAGMIEVSGAGLKLSDNLAD